MSIRLLIRVENAFEPEGFGKSLEELSATIEKHYQHLVQHNLIGSRVRRKAVVELNEAIRNSVLEPVLNRLVQNGEIEGMIQKLINKETDPYTLAEDVARRYLKECSD